MRERCGRLGGGDESAGLTGEAVQDHFAGWGFDEDQDDVGKPGIQGCEVETLGHVIGVEELEDVEVEEIEAVAALANQKQRTPGEERGDGMGTAEAKDDGGKEGGHEAAVHEEVGGVADKGVEEESDEDETDSGEDETLARGEDESVLQFAKSDAGEKGADVGEWGVFEETEKLGGAIAIDGADDVIGVQVEIEGVGDETDDPEGDEESDQTLRRFGPGQADEPGEGEVENALAGEGPGYGVPEGGDGGAPTLKNKRGEDDSLPELAVGAGVPLVLEHADREDEDEEIDGIEARETGEPELALREGFAAVGVVVGEDVARDDEEDTDEDVSVIDEGIEEAEVRGREVKEDDEDGEQGADASEGGEGWLASGCGLMGRGRRLLDLGFGFQFEEAGVHRFVLLIGCMRQSI
jgi:hypothetical protein